MSRQLHLVLLFIIGSISWLHAQSIAYEQAAEMFTGVFSGSMAFADVDGDNDQDVLITGAVDVGQTIAKLYKNDGAGNFTEVIGTPFPGVSGSSIAFADVDGDTDLDVLIEGFTGYNTVGTSIAKLYLNDGAGNFTEAAGTPFVKVSRPSVTFGDIDGDNDQDVLITGTTNTGSSFIEVTILYKNDGGGNYSAVIDTPFDSLTFASVAFADVDGDADLDVLMSGSISSGLEIAKLYRNDGSGNFSEVTGTPFAGVDNGSVAFADVDGDNDQDVFITGYGWGRTAKLYKNDGVGNYTEVTDAPFEGVGRSSMAFADVDGDNDQDIFIAGGTSYSGLIARLYENDGAGNYSEVTETPFDGIWFGSIGLADVDGDGDQDILVTGENTADEKIAKLYLKVPCTPRAPAVDVASLADLVGECSVDSPTPPTANDGCGTIFTGTTTTAFPITAQGTTIVTWTYDDGNGNTITQDQNVIIKDTTGPVADLASLPDVEDECTVAAVTAPTATDNCSGAITGTTTTTFPITTKGTTVVTWTYDDGYGNTSTQDQNVIIKDNQRPVPDLASLPDVVGECSVASITAPTATDNCSGAITGTTTTTFPITTQGKKAVYWRFEDGKGNGVTKLQYVIIKDVTGPVADLTSLPDVVGECSVASITAPTATDNCSGAITGTTTTTFPITAQGTTVVTWTYDDGHGNTSTQDQKVIITDDTKPVADLASLPDVVDECAVASITAPTATDNCSGAITGTTTTTFPITTKGTTTVTWTYDDGHGNVITQNQNVIITDDTDPVADLASLPEIEAMCEINSALTPAPTATDNCAGSLTATSDVTFPITDQAITQITWTYDDGNGNTITQNQSISWTVLDVSTSINGTEITAMNPNGTYRWLNCDNNYAPVPGETGVSFTPTTSGSYAVEITENGCVDTSSCVSTKTLGIIENTFGNALKIHPNPTFGKFSIDLGANYSAVQIRINDLNGRVILFKAYRNSQYLDLNLEEPDGVYLVTLETADKSAVIRLVKH